MFCSVSTRSLCLGALGILLVAAGCGGGSSRAPSPDPDPVTPPNDDGSPRIVLDPAVRFQTMNGWEATAQASQDLSPLYLGYRDQLFDQAVDQLGLDRLRVEVRSGVEYSSDTYAARQAGQITQAQWRPVRYATVNDNNDPFVLNAAGFWFTELDNQIEKVVLPMRQRLEARGRRLFITICYVAFTSQIEGGAYHHRDAEEYAEFVQATYQHLAERYGIRPDAWEMHLEPDNTSQWTGAYMRQAMIATGNRLRAIGVEPAFIAPSTTNMSNAIGYGDQIAAGGVPPFWKVFSYHRYSGVSEDALRTIASRANQWGLQTAMLEHIGSGYQDLHQDLKVGNNSLWQRFILAGPGNPDAGGTYFVIDVSNPLAPRVSLSAQTRILQQYFRYIRSGAVRFGASTSHGDFDPVAFTNPDGRQVVVVKAERGGAFAVQGLAAGGYELTYSTESQADVRLGAASVGAGDLMRITMPDRGVLTIAAQ